MGWLKRRICGTAGQRNWFGDGSDGDIRITSAGAEQSFDGGVTWAVIPSWILVGTVVSIPSVQDGDMVVVNARSLTVDAGYTLTVANRCRGLLIFATGDITINGEVSMTARGCHANPADATVTADTPVAPSDGQPVDEAGLTLGWFASGFTGNFAPSLNGCGQAAVEAIANQPSGKGLTVVIPRVGGLGAPRQTAYDDGLEGGTVENSAGGGGGGGNGGTASGGGGGDATCFAGGPGGGGNGGNADVAKDGDDNGGPGGGGVDNGDMVSGGGAGNPGGLGGISAESTYENGAGEDGCGGLLLLVAGRDLILNSGALLSSVGSRGGAYDPGPTGCAGGGSGGGLVGLFYARNLINDCDHDVSGGLGGVGLRVGGPGGVGTVIGPHKIDPA